MPEFSMPWDDVAVGDGQPYTWDEWHSMLDHLFVADKTQMGVVRDYLNELEPTEPLPGTARIDVDTGAALVDGRMYYNDSSVQVTTGFGPSTTGQIVLQLVNATRTIRIVNRASGALVQTPGVQWEIPLCSWQTDGASNITVLDDLRVFAISPLAHESIIGGGDMRLLSSQGTLVVTNTINFPSIAQGFNSLLLTGYVHSDAGGSNDTLSLRINADAGANYSHFGWIGSAGNTPYSSYGASSILVGTVPAVGGTLSWNGGIFEIWIPNYKNASQFKALLSQCGSIPNTPADVTYEYTVNCGYWLNKNPITSLDLILTSGNFVNRSTSVQLYGIP